METEQAPQTFTLPNYGTFTLPLRSDKNWQGTPGGGHSITGTQNLAIAAILTTKGALKLETKGLRVTRGYSAYKTVKAIWGFKGTKEKVFEQLEAWCARNIKRGTEE